MHKKIRRILTRYKCQAEIILPYTFLKNELLLDFTGSKHFHVLSNRRFKI